ncbi:ABC transporter permease [Bifidobacterium tissieri]|uniref:ABC transporter permease n=2 Tax=Bifidobacterium tissieri TaxID=1630162 RepID=A0A5M9ZWK1_9BIFI|nr:ABC transporter permease [Bifidobacterium tissieri]KAA8833386.1 ABC transporter permease [Bifidobacterium tissieri]
MVKQILQRLLYAVVILFLLSIFVFALFYIAPGNPARLIAGEKASQEVLDQVTRNLGLDKPLWQQYLTFITNAFHGDFGISYRNQTPVIELIVSRLPVTFSLVGGAVVLWLLIGVPLGVLSATHPGTWKDRLAQVLSQLFISFPSFVLGMFLLYMLYYLPKRNGFTLLPPGGYTKISEGFPDWAWHMILPWLTLALLMAALYQRLTRAEMIDVLGEDYIRTARAKGLSERAVIYKHGLRSTLTVLTTQLGADIGSLLSGSIIIEQVFGLQGVGALAVKSVNTQDRPVIIGVVLLGGFFIVMMNLLVDVLHVALEPTLRR